MRINPKVRFLASPQARDYTDRIAADWFQVAAEAALAEYAVRLGQPGNPQQSWDAHNRMVGAVEFMNLLMNLGVPGREPPRGESPNLDYSLSKPPEKP